MLETWRKGKKGRKRWREGGKEGGKRRREEWRIWKEVIEKSDALRRESTGEGNTKINGEKKKEKKRKRNRGENI